MHPIKIAQTGLQTLNVVGLVSEILEYRARIRMIDLEIEQVIRQAEVMHHKIQTEHDQAIQKLMNERMIWMGKFEVVMMSQRQTSFETQQLLNDLSKLTSFMTSSASLEEMKIVRDAMADIRAMVNGQQHVRVEAFKVLMLEKSHHADVIKWLG